MSILKPDKYCVQPLKWAKEALEKPEQEFFIDWLQGQIDHITHQNYRDAYLDGKLSAYLQIRWVLHTGGFNKYRIPTALRLTMQSSRMYMASLLKRIIKLISL